MLARDHLTLPSADKVEGHQQVETVISMACEDKGRETGARNADAQFFLQLADQTVFRRFTGLELSAGELPKAGQLLAFGTLTDQHTAVGVDQGRRSDKNHAFFAHVAVLGLQRQNATDRRK